MNFSDDNIEMMSDVGAIGSMLQAMKTHKKVYLKNDECLFFSSYEAMFLINI